MKQVWCSSDLDRPIVSFTIRDVDGDGLSLVVEEGKVGISPYKYYVNQLSWEVFHYNEQKGLKI